MSGLRGRVKHSERPSRRYGPILVVLCWSGLAWPSANVDYAALRRLLISAEGCSAISFIFRPVSAATAASPALLRLRLETAHGDLAVHILKRRGNPSFRPVILAAGAMRPLPIETAYTRSAAESLDHHASTGIAGGVIPASSLHA